MQTLYRFGHHDQPEKCFLETADGGLLELSAHAWHVVKMPIDLRPLLQAAAYQFSYQDGVIQITLWIDEEQYSSIPVCAAPNCAPVHRWISRANRMIAKRV